MAKAVITAVRKDENGVITHVKVSVEIDGKLVPDGERTKLEVIQAITQHRVHYTVPSGEEVRVVDGRYIRSIANDTKEDNLGELPIF